MAEGEAGEFRALLSLGREANGRSIGAGLEAAVGAAAVGVLGRRGSRNICSL